ncbi:putative orphan protein [Pseudoalteromonas translucida]|uniref:Orphan protein n=1 Tax=Pseudoalteromonas translucida (strain TAC 125) TaxID=326442 RepID=Q3IK53_PSET1|nr:putative orphan protein [Pseudoalteromonas translucida]
MSAANRVRPNHHLLKSALINQLNQINRPNSNRITGLIKVSLAHLLIMHLKSHIESLNTWYLFTKLT